ncbi:VOC family protein [Streptomyces polyrhachis]|uniref:VOC family protein n=1 Tax=Streptomyces polyrhachis TaxID=1282885 RepID=A0ABW2GHB8_9ACTN
MNARFNAIGMVVSDLAASLAFYRLLGIDIPPQDAGEPHVEAQLPGGVRLMWDTEESVRAFDPQWRPPADPGRLQLAFALDTPAGVDKLHERVTGEGYGSHRAPWDAPWGQRYATVTDPDGNRVDLYAPLAP